MFKRILTAGMMACMMFSAAALVTPAAHAAGATMDNYAEMRTSSPLSKLDAVDVAEARRTAPELKEVGDWNRKIGYILGTKEYALTTGWTPLTVQLITPYSLTKHVYFQANKALEAPNQELLEEIQNYKDVAWIWVWSNGTFALMSAANPAPTVENVIIQTKDNELCYYLDKEKYIPVKAMASAKVPGAQLWPFPAKLFSGKNIPFDIVIVDSAGNKKPLRFTPEMLEKCK